MAKVIFFSLVSLFAIYGISNGLECYHCYSNGQKAAEYGDKFVACNEFNITASNTWVCPHVNSVCVFQVVEFETNHLVQTWRSCSNGVSDPCDPNNLPPGLKMMQCSTCKTDRCNLYYSRPNNNTFTFNINANVNLYMRQ